MTVEEYHNIFMVNAMCCYGKQASCIAEKKQIGKQVRINELYNLKLLYLFNSAFKCYNTECITEAQYQKIYESITEMCNFCKCSQTITT